MIKKMSSSGLSDGDIAKKLSTHDDPIATATVNRWRNGVHKKISFDRYIRIEKALSELKEEAT